MFDIAPQLSLTASLSLSELSSAAKFYLDCGVHSSLYQNV